MAVLGVLLLILSITELVYAEEESLSNVTDTRRNQGLPEIRDGEICIPGQMYKNECNTCKCTKDGGLMCTKMACINWSTRPKQKSLARGRKALQSSQSPKAAYLPKLPRDPCKPGKLYRSGCRKCFCNDKQKIVCSKKKNDACIFDKDGNPTPIRTPEDVRPSFSASLRTDIETLPSASEKCTPGKSYRVDCNNCICMSSKDLVCQQKLCISYDDMNRLEAESLSGKKCSPGKKPAVSSCVNCECVSFVMRCVQKPACVPAIAQKLSSSQQIKSELSLPHENCIPDTVYRVNCNKCYCQPDGSLRCTQKSCLNHSQIRLLKKQREYLEKHGL